MVTYNPRDWFKIIVHFHRSDTFRILLPTMLLLGIISAGTVYLFQHWKPDYHPALTIFHQISGFIISLVLVFRINTAYDRWWEGRKLWGALINTSRSMGARLALMISKDDTTSIKAVRVLLSAFPVALKEHLRNRRVDADIAFPSSLASEEFSKWQHKPNYLLMLLDRQCREISRHSGNTNDYLILSNYLTQLSDICGACERIKNTPIPYSYSVFIKKIIFIYIITMPLSFGLSLGYWSVPMVMIIFYAFASLEIISEEIEDPFGTDSNDLPTDEIAGRIAENLKEILKDT